MWAADRVAERRSVRRFVHCVLKRQSRGRYRVPGRRSPSELAAHEGDKYSRGCQRRPRAGGSGLGPGLLDGCGAGMKTQKTIRTKAMAGVARPPPDEDVMALGGGAHWPG